MDMKINTKDQKYITDKLAEISAILGGLVLNHLVWKNQKVNEIVLLKANKYIEKIVYQIYKRGSK